MSEGAEDLLHELAVVYTCSAPTAEEAEEDLEHISTSTSNNANAFVPEPGEFELL